MILLALVFVELDSEVECKKNGGHFITEEMALIFVGFYCVSAFDNTLDLI